MSKPGMDAKNPVLVDVLSFTQLFTKTDLPLAVDTYQRGFVWNDKKIRELVGDLQKYQSDKAPKPPYYMGTILLHQNDSRVKKYIIDGQQRLTALCVLNWQMKGNLPDNCELTYSPKSAQCIRRAAEVFKNLVDDLDESVFDQIVFTVIYVDRVDLAFTFFDTQNNRGVKLHATDLLKAYHLRAVEGGDKEPLQKWCAQRWESIQQGQPVLAHGPDFMPSLFSHFLWRARNWTGKRVRQGGHEALLNEFQVRSWPNPNTSDTIPLYRSRNNRLGTALTLKPEGHSEIQSSTISLSNRAVDLPFAIRQPVHEGIGFFLYADKYAALLQWLMLEETLSREVLAFRALYNTLIMANSLYLREVFLIAALMFVDQFGDEKLCAFGLWLEHVLGAIRLEKKQVRVETAQNFLKDHDLNLLDVIASSYLPEQVFAHLQQNYRVAELYTNENIDGRKGVQGRYKQAVLRYFNQSDNESLEGKEGWLRANLKGRECND